MLSLFLAPAGANNVLILGDSIAEFSGRSMSEYCAGNSYVNMAVGGSSLSQWGAPGGGSSKPQHCEDVPHKPCRPANGFALQPIIPYTHVWFSSGSNDFATYHCRPTEDQWTEITTNMNRALDNILAVAPPKIPVVMLRYPKPGMVLNECVRDDLSLMPFDEMMVAFDKMNSALEAACTTHSSGRCKYVKTAQFPDATTERYRTNKTAPDTFDQCTYHRDGMHLNNHGFCHWFTQSQAQDAFGCKPATYDCSKSGITLPGSPELHNIEGQCTDYVFDAEAIDKNANQTRGKGSSIGNLGAGKTDFHFVIDHPSPPQRTAIDAVDHKAGMDKQINDYNSNNGTMTKNGTVKIGIPYEMRPASSLFSGTNGTVLRGLLDVDGEKRWEVWPGFTVDSKPADAIRKDAARASLVAPPGADQPVVHSANALQPQ